MAFTKIIKLVEPEELLENSKKKKIENVFLKILTITILRRRVPKRGERNMLPIMRE